MGTSKNLPDKFTDHLGNTCTVISEHIRRDDGTQYVTYKCWVWLDKDKMQGQWEFHEEQRVEIIHKLTTNKYKRDDLCL